MSQHLTPHADLSSTSRLHRRVSETTGLCQIELSDKTVVLIAHIIDRPWVVSLTTALTLLICLTLCAQAGALRYTPVISVEVRQVGANLLRVVGETRPQKLTLGALDKDTTHLQALAAACDVKALRDLKIWVFDHSFVPWLGLFHQCAAQLATFRITGVGLSAFSEDPTGSGLPEMPLLTHLKMDVSPTEQCLKQLIKLVESVKLDTLYLRGFDSRFKWNILRATQGALRKLLTWGWETEFAEHLPALKVIELFSDYDRWTPDGIVPPAPDLPQTLEVLHLGRCSLRSRQDRVLRTWPSDETWLRI